MTNSLLKLTEIQIQTIDPIAYSINFDCREHRKVWYISFTGEKQAILSDEIGNKITFSDESKAIAYCQLRWPSIKKI